ncbi:co-chaperone GroES [Patescibacteria group bacterium]|nr:co-chaperone GroES [Patescibacteria group bacterium]
MKKSQKKSDNNKSLSAKYSIEPLGSRVLLKPFTREDVEGKNNFGIILPEKDSKDKSDQGIVLAVGPGEWKEGTLVPVGVKVGEKVIFSKYGYEEVKQNDEELYLVKEDNILAIIK